MAPSPGRQTHHPRDDPFSLEQGRVLPSATDQPLSQRIGRLKHPIRVDPLTAQRNRPLPVLESCRVQFRRVELCRVRATRGDRICRVRSLWCYYGV